MKTKSGITAKFFNCKIYASWKLPPKHIAYNYASYSKEILRIVKPNPNTSKENKNAQIEQTDHLMQKNYWGVIENINFNRGIK